MSHNEITHFPGDAFDTTTYATVFQLSYNQLTDLSKVPLKNMTGLKVLNVSHNAIETIPKNTFPKLYELHTIDASFNNISDIFNGVFQTLFSLRFLNLSHNSLETLKSSTFGPLSTLLEMDLSDNILSNIARSAFTKLSSLQLLNLENNKLEKLFQIPISCSQLNLRRNQLTEIPERTWPTMNALLLLDLSHNRLENNLNGGSFNGLLTLQTLILSSNGITEVPWESFVPLSTLQYLHLENNNLTKLAKGAFGKLPVVFELNLFNNQISDISKKAFDGLLALLTLNLSTNSLETIPNDAFASLVALRTLDLSHNKLEKLDNKTNSIIEDCLSLIEIDLSFNRISFVTKKTFPSDPYVPYRLAKINLSHNKLPLITKDITFGTKKVTHLNISHNAISSFLPGALGNLTSLEVLDVSYNKIWDLCEANVFNLPENLTELYVSANNLAEIPMKEIVNASHLKILDVKFNKLTSLDQKLLNKIMIEGLQVNLEDPSSITLNPLHESRRITKNFICYSPMHIENQPLADVTDVQLNCPEDPFSEDYSALPDLQFREISFFRGNLLVRWFVTAQRDIADFYVLIRDEANAILFERHTSYDTRMVTIAKEEIFGTNGPQKAVQICVMAKLSTGNIERWFESQCKNLPENFSHETSHYKTVLFSTEPHSRRKLLLTSAISSSSRIHGKIIPKYSIILALISLYFI
uniref:Uncharacterized protein n=2 Tax=Lutzomyia longipalpis TaxID=7200 RepID=A0A1B0GJZ8_LUTLO